MTQPPSHNATPLTAQAPWGGPLGKRELVVMLACCFGLNALAIDTMLPALDDIAAHYNLAHANQQQWVVFSYILGFGVPQLFAGPLSDRIGRKIILRVSFIFYVLFGFACMFTPTFEALLAARLLQGVSAAGIRVTATSIVRDLFEGRAMARTMSLILTIFMVIPIIGPSVGQLVLWVTDWRWTFGILGLFGFFIWVWLELRLPETLAPDARRSLRPQIIASGYWTIITTPVTIGYILASGIMFGALFSFIGSSEQIFSDVFDQEAFFALWFAAIAGALTIANFTNSRIVERFGMRRISHAALCLFIITSALNMGLCHIYGARLIFFFPLFSISFGCFGMIGANFSALAMEPLGKLAGTGAAAYGFSTSTLSSLIGLFLAARFDGTLGPLLFGNILIGLCALILVLITEKGRLFRDGSAERAAKRAQTR